MEAMGTLQVTDMGAQSVATEHFGKDAQVVGMSPDGKGFMVDRGGGKMILMPESLVKGVLLREADLEAQESLQGGNENNFVDNIIKDLSVVSIGEKQFSEGVIPAHTVDWLTKTGYPIDRIQRDFQRVLESRKPKQNVTFAGMKRWERN
jgi:hypothetical protein